MLLLHKQAHHKRGTAESLHVYTNRARLTASEVGYFERNITILENTPTPLFEEPLKFIVHVRISRDYGTIIHESALSEIYSGYLMSLLVTTNYQVIELNIIILCSGS